MQRILILLSMTTRAFTLLTASILQRSSFAFAVDRACSPIDGFEADYNQYSPHSLLSCKALQQLDIFTSSFNLRAPPGPSVSAFHLDSEDAPFGQLLYRACFPVA